MFCSTLQQHLGEIGQGSYTFGQAQHATLSQDVRLRVRDRVMSEYPVLFYGMSLNALCVRPTVSVRISSDASF